MLTDLRVFKVSPLAHDVVPSTAPTYVATDPRCEATPRNIADTFSASASSDLNGTGRWENPRNPQPQVNNV